MANIEKLNYGEFLRPTTAHAIGKINEIIDNLDGSGSGSEFEIVIVDPGDEYSPYVSKTANELHEIYDSHKLAFANLYGEHSIITNLRPEYHYEMDDELEVGMAFNFIASDEGDSMTRYYVLVWYDETKHPTIMPTNIKLTNIPIINVTYDAPTASIMPTVTYFYPSDFDYPNGVIVKDEYFNETALGQVITINDGYRLVYRLNHATNNMINFITVTIDFDLYGYPINGTIDTVGISSS